MKKIIEKNINLVSKYPKWIIGLALILSLLAVWSATGLDLELSWVALAPKGNPAVQEYEQILEDFPTIDNVIVIVESEDPANMKEIVGAVQEEMTGLTDYVSSVTAGLDQDFAIDYGLNYMSLEEAQMMGYLFADPNLDSFYMGMSLYMDLLDEELEKADLSSEDRKYMESTKKALDDISDITLKALEGQVDSQALKAGYDRALKLMFAGDTLITSPDGKMTTVMVQPSFDMMDLQKLEPGVAAMEEVIFSLRDQYPDAKIGITGIHIVGRDETASIESDSQVTTLLAVVLIFLLLYIAFRGVTAPIFTFIPLIFGIIWDVGLIRLMIGRLNMLTAFSAAMIIGLGIDFSIHLYSAYTEQRSLGLDKHEALSKSMITTGPSIIVGAMTTACAFLALNMSQLDMLGELGSVMASGIATTLIAVFWVLPALIILKKEKEGSIRRIKGQYPLIGSIAKFVHKRKAIVAVLLLIVIGTMGFIGRGIQFDLDLMNLEPEGLESIAWMDYMVEEYDMSTDALNVSVDSLEEVYRLEDVLGDYEGIHDISSIADVLPKDRDKNTFDEKSDVIKGLMEEQVPKRTQDSMMVTGLIQDYLDNYNPGHAYVASENMEDTYGQNMDQVNEIFYDSMLTIGQRMAESPYLSVDQLPDSYKAQFVSKDGDRFLVSFYPSFGIWDNLKSDKGIDFVNKLTQEAPDVTGTPLFMKIMYETAASEALLTGGVIMIVLFIILLLHFRSLKYAVIGFIPLIAALIMTVGTMTLIKLDFNILNFLGLLLIIGIGVDDGVHILHHYLEEDRSIEDVFSSVGRAILLTSLTTMIGFGSLIFSSYRGIATLGSVLIIGVGYAFLMTVLIIPLLIKDRKN